MITWMITTSHMLWSCDALCYTETIILTVCASLQSNVLTFASLRADSRGGGGGTLLLGGDMMMFLQMDELR